MVLVKRLWTVFLRQSLAYVSKVSSLNLIPLLFSIFTSLRVCAIEGGLQLRPRRFEGVDGVYSILFSRFSLVSLEG